MGLPLIVSLFLCISGFYKKKTDSFGGEGELGTPHSTPMSITHLFALFNLSLISIRLARAMPFDGDVYEYIASSVLGHLSSSTPHLVTA